MTTYCVVAQKPHDIEITHSSDNLSQSQAEAITSQAFPTGSNWSSVVGARSLHLFPVSNQEYSLAYSLVLGKAPKRRAGTLHAWVLLDGEEVWDAWFREAKSLASIFIHYAPFFVRDPVYNEMETGLRDGEELPSVGLPLIANLSAQFGQRIEFKSQFVNSYQWSYVETLVKHTVTAGYWSRNIFRKMGASGLLPSFTTFSLSNSEPSQIVGLAYDPTGVIQYQKKRKTASKSYVEHA